ncbi:hypothetical protein ACFVRR_24145 [Gottfriedia sp. NPDC057948]|uniref:hypothetical protein n=1 Tax=Gottfriedia sp. NPDC057948 TaxID=3346287 RepID=UPI0036DC7C45
MIKIEIKVVSETVETHYLEDFDVSHFFDKVFLCREIAKYLNQVYRLLVQIEILGLKVTEDEQVIFEDIRAYEQYLHEHDIVFRNNLAYVKGELYQE